jgi:hypothetical protein
MNNYWTLWNIDAQAWCRWHLLYMEPIQKWVLWPTLPLLTDDPLLILMLLIWILIQLLIERRWNWWKRDLGNELNCPLHCYHRHHRYCLLHRWLPYHHRTRWLTDRITIHPIALLLMYPYPHQWQCRANQLQRLLMWEVTNLQSYPPERSHQRFYASLRMLVTCFSVTKRAWSLRTSSPVSRAAFMTHWSRIGTGLDRSLSMHYCSKTSWKNSIINGWQTTGSRMYAERCWVRSRPAHSGNGRWKCDLGIHYCVEHQCISTTLDYWTNSKRTWNRGWVVHATTRESRRLTSTSGWIKWRSLMRRSAAAQQVTNHQTMGTIASPACAWWEGVLSHNGFCRTLAGRRRF